MWQAVDPANLAQLQEVVDVLVVHDSTWPTAERLQQWIVAHGTRFFYYPAADYQLVIAFEREADSGNWTLRAGGARGNLVPESGNQMADKVVEFMHAESLTELPMYSYWRSPMDPEQMLLEAGLELLRHHPEVAQVQEQADPRGRRYEVVLR